MGAEGRPGARGAAAFEFIRGKKAGLGPATTTKPAFRLSPQLRRWEVGPGRSCPFLAAPPVDAQRENKPEAYISQALGRRSVVGELLENVCYGNVFYIQVSAIYLKKKKKGSRKPQDLAGSLVRTGNIPHRVTPGDQEFLPRAGRRSVVQRRYPDGLALVFCHVCLYPSVPALGNSRCQQVEDPKSLNFAPAQPCLPLMSPRQGGEGRRVLFITRKAHLGPYKLVWPL